MSTLDPTTALKLSDLPDRVHIFDNTEALRRVREVIQTGPYADSWESLAGYRPPRWYQDAKFGIFLHWGIYSVPAFGNEWYARTMYLEGSPAFEHHRRTYGDHRQFGYKDFIPGFTMANFDPDAWAALFRRAGAQFIVPVAEHHDGFALYETDRSRWNAARMGPKRDVYGDLMSAVDRAWMVRGASSHRAEHWFFMNGGSRFDSDVRDPRFSDFYGPAQREETAPSDLYLQDWLLRTLEIIDKYRPQVLWFDWWIEQPAFEPYLRQLAAYYYNRAAAWGTEVVINYKWDAFAPGSAVLDIERGAMAGVRPQVWQNDTSVSRSSWGWVEDHQYKSPRDIVAELVDTVAKNGNFLLNIGPKPDGTIADEEQRILTDIGDWLTRYGEAIFGTRPWMIAGEGPTQVQVGSFVDATSPRYRGEDIRFTTRTDVTGDYLYAILLAAPADGVARVRSLGHAAGLLDRQISQVTLLGHKQAPAWNRDAEGLQVDVPAEPTGISGPVIKIHLEPEPIRRRTDFLHG